jgi:hypothetical protein
MWPAQVHSCALEPTLHYDNIGNVTYDLEKVTCTCLNPASFSQRIWFTTAQLFLRSFTIILNNLDRYRHRTLWSIPRPGLPYLSHIFLICWFYHLWKLSSTPPFCFLIFFSRFVFLWLLSKFYSQRRQVVGSYYWLWWWATIPRGIMACQCWSRGINSIWWIRYFRRCAFQSFLSGEWVNLDGGMRWPFQDL